MNAQEKLIQLRSVLWERHADGFLLPVADEFLGEYVPASAARLEWLTGFTGSAGLAVVLAESAALFTDGRYTLQAKQEVSAAHYAQFNSADCKPEQWVVEHLDEGMALGFDPWLHSQREVEKLEQALAPKHIRLVPLIPNPVDALWEDRPAAPESVVEIHPEEYAGEAHQHKQKKVVEALRKAGAHMALLAASDSVDWLLNIRGRDVPYSPLLLAYGLIEESGRTALYVDPQRVSADVRAHLVPGVEVRDPALLPGDLAEIGGRKWRVLADPALTPSWFVSTLRSAGAEVVLADDPCQRLKAIKNKVEMKGMQRAHERDGLALTRFLCWLDKETPHRDMTEREAVARLLEFRRQAPEFVSPSFETIAGSGPNGAIVHYRVTQGSNRVLHQNDLFLLDSGGQYPDGTTDVTRTVAIGEPAKEHREHFTRVLKGHIALALAHFPEGTSGSQLDALARHPLWCAGLDYDHGTGHGVGCFLNVHEGPQRIGKRGGDAALEAGMIVSNEPGYYREGRYGIRIENLVQVVRVGEMANGKAMLGFETITCVPMDLRLVDAALLDADEKKWLNTYHERVFDRHEDKLDSAERAWLENATRNIA